LVLTNTVSEFICAWGKERFHLTLYSLVV